MLDLSASLLLLPVTSTWNALALILHQSLLGKTQAQGPCPPGALLDAKPEESLAHFKRPQCSIHIVLPCWGGAELG